MIDEMSFVAKNPKYMIVNDDKGIFFGLARLGDGTVFPLWFPFYELSWDYNIVGFDTKKEANKVKKYIITLESFLEKIPEREISKKIYITDFDKKLSDDLYYSFLHRQIMMHDKFFDGYVVDLSDFTGKD